MKKLFLAQIFIIILLPACRKPQYKVAGAGLDLIKITQFDSNKLSNFSNCSKPDQLHEGKRAVKVTIFVHGTKFAPDWFLHDFFYSIAGIHHVNDYSSKYRLFKLAKMICSADPVDFDFEHFYLFGWSGKLSFKERADAAARLWDDLNILIARYQQLGYMPEISIITHSHGGNVVLNLAKKQPNITPSIMIDRLILLACPVQKETEAFVTNPMFKKVYAFCSGVDTIQLLDPQGIQCKDKKTPMFSDRFFKNSPNLFQAKIKINGRGLMHVEFLLGHFLTKMPIFIDRLESKGKPGSQCIISYWDNKFLIK